MTAAPERSQGPALATRAVRGALWSLVSQGVQVAVGLLSFVLLSPWLSPDDFGKFALALTATGLLGVVGDTGVTAALVRRDELDARVFASAFWLSLGGALLLAALAAASAPLISWFFDDEQLLWLSLAMAAQFPALVLGRVPTARLTKSLRFRALATVGLGSSLAGLGVGLACAASGLGAWSLVLLTLTTGFVGAVATFAVAPSPLSPRLVTKPLLRELGAFGSKLSGFSLALTLSRWLDGPLIGRFVGQRPIGLLQMALRLASVPVQRVAGAVSSVFLPTIVQLSEPEARARALARALETLNLAVVPFCVGVATIAEEIVALLPAQWSDLAPALRCIALAAILEPTGFISIAVVTAEGRAGSLLRATLLMVPANWLAPILGAATGDALVFFVAWAASNAFGGVLLYQLARRALGVSNPMPAGFLAPTALALTMAVAVRAVLWLADLGGTRLGFLVGAATGAVVYTTLAFTLRRDALARAWQLLRRAKG